jgi:hypothetical protein
MNVKVNVKVDIDKMIANKIELQAYKALQVGAEYLLTESLKTTPKEDGILRASGKTSGNENLMTTMVSFDTPYAVRLHEHPEYNFQGTGRGKWLELTMNEERDAIAKLIAQKIDASINKGGGI